MFVVKRDGRRERVHFDKITNRIEKLTFGLSSTVNVHKITQKVIEGLYDGVKTTELDALASEVAASMTLVHADYAVLAARIAINNLHKETEKQFSKVVEQLYVMVDSSGRKTPIIDDKTYAVVQKHAEFLDSRVIHRRDDAFDYFGFQTLIKSYLLKDSRGRVVERPQHLYMRVAVGIHGEDLDRVVETYDLLSQRVFTHATPTLFNAGTPRNQMSSCFLTTVEDSIEGIYDMLKNAALMSKTGGGIGLAAHNIRANGSYIAGTNGTSNGIVPMLKVLNATMRYVDQGGNKRPGSCAVYLEPWHADIFEFLQLKKNTGAEELRARDLFLALWIPDLFMRRVEADAHWTLMCPSECPGLADVYGDEFDRLYVQYETEGRGRKTVEARKLWHAILESQTESGTPYMVYKDAVNSKSNQQNLGTIKCSNLCTEIVEYTSSDEIAVCTLASLSLPAFVTAGEFDFARLHAVVRTVTHNLNRIIDINYYPLPQHVKSNTRNRPLGLGVQGLADVFCMLSMPFTSPDARKLNVQIFETIYHAALTESCALAARDGPYATYQKSPVSKGILQYDMWTDAQGKPVVPTDLWDWSALKADIAKHGVRNSLLVAPMPTASTSQILGNNEAFEPFTSNLYTRNTKAGAFQVVNRHLMRDLERLGLWTPGFIERLKASRGSVQQMTDLPDWIRAVYKTVWEMPQRDLVDMAADRAPFIDQSMSLNVFIAEPNTAKLTSLHFHAWRRGLKTGMYYLRTRPAADPIPFTVEPQQKDGIACALNNREACMACSS